MTVKLKQILIIIFLGSLGSGFWDLFLKDALFSLGNIFVVAFSSFSSGYIDSLYSDVGTKGEAIVLFPAFIFLVLLCFFPICLFVIAKRQINKLEYLCNEKVSEEPSLNEIEKTKTYLLKKWLVLKYVFFVLTTSTSLIYIDMAISFVSEYQAYSVVERRLVIVRPYISENEFYKLTSESRLVDDLQSLQRLINKTEFIAVENELKLPEFYLYGVTLPNLKD